LLVGHGSPKKEAIGLDHIARLLHGMIHNDCGKECVRVAYLQFGEPGLASALDACAKDGAKRVIIHPYFLSSGVHVTKEIPAVIREAEKRHPEVEFVYTEPLGVHNKLAELVLERINAASGIKPSEIETKSFEMIAEETDLSRIPEEQKPVVQRVIHATADFEFKNSLVFHPDAVKAGIEAIRAGRDILTDIEMVRTGINKRLLEKWGGKVVCNIQTTELRQQNLPAGRQGTEHRQQTTDNRAQNAEREGPGGCNKTRAEAGIEMALQKDNNIGIVAIGNAPTALLKAIEILSDHAGKGDFTPLLVGVPVGFVKALESKSLLATQQFPFITNLSRKGGTPVAVAIVNALLKMAAERE